MPPVSRRELLTGLGLAGLAAAGYASILVPGFFLNVTSYALTPKTWPRDLALRIAVIADIHAGEPHMSARHIIDIVAEANRQKPDLVVLMGDYVANHPFVTRHVPMAEWSAILATIKAPLGVFSVLGNHDWWDDRLAQERRGGPTRARLALEAAGIQVLENDAVRLEKSSRAFWLLGLADQLALRPLRGASPVRGLDRFKGLHDLSGTIARATDDAPAILLAHEPDIFTKVPDRVALTISGHTHGGQIRIAGYSPVVPSRYGNRFAYGHVVEQGRHLVVSGGLGTSGLPVRVGVPPEIVMITLGDMRPAMV